MRKLVLLAIIGIAAIGLAGQAQAANINWAAAMTVAADTDVSTSGTLVYATSASNQIVTVNGVTFASRTFSASPGFPGYQNVGLGGATFSSNYGNILSWNTWITTSQSVTLAGLTAGNTYQLQVWARDWRYGSTQSVRVAAGNYVDLLVKQGQYAIGTFTADAATQVFTVSGDGAFNALQLRDVTPVPEPSCVSVLITGALGLTGFGIRRRK